MVSTYVDYLWFEERFPDLAEAYCVTLVDDETSSGLLDRFGVVGDRVDRVGVGELIDRSYAVLDAHQGMFSSSRRPPSGRGLWRWRRTAISA